MFIHTGHLHPLAAGGIQKMDDVSERKEKEHRVRHKEEAKRASGEEEKTEDN